MKTTIPSLNDKWTNGIQNEEHAQLVGQVITYLPHVEEKLIAFLARLLGHLGNDHGPARQVFRAIESERARIQVMNALLEQQLINQHKPPIFKEVVSLFKSIKNNSPWLAWFADHP
jgi:hypothetical protein